ncbi:MAG: tyrosine-type recombinase/integrase [Desulfobaccales bacterium]
MSLFRDNRTGLWRWEFEHNKERFTGYGYKTKGEARTAREEKRKEVKKPKTPEGMDFKELANLYLDYAERKFVPKTYKYKASVYRQFLEHCGTLPAEKITIPIIESYLKTRQGNINYNRHRKDLCALFHWAYRRRLIPENLCDWLEKMPEPKYHREIPTQEEMSKIILAAGEYRPFILVLYHTLARLDEALRLRWSDVNFTDRTVILWTRKRMGGEWESDIIFMNQVLYDTLWGLWQGRKQDEWVFYNRVTGGRYNRRPKIMRTICAQAGVQLYGFHAIRHYVASRLFDEKKWSMAKVSRLLRHQNKQTTEKYLQVEDQGLRQVMESLEGDF